MLLNATLPCVILMQKLPEIEQLKCLWPANVQRTSIALLNSNKIEVGKVLLPTATWMTTVNKFHAMSYSNICECCIRATLIKLLGAVDKSETLTKIKKMSHILTLLPMIEKSKKIPTKSIDKILNINDSNQAWPQFNLNISWYERISTHMTCILFRILLVAAIAFAVNS